MRMWEIKQQTDPNVLEMYIYGDVEGNGYDWWLDKEIKSETSAKTFRDELNKYPNVGEIRLYINSYGGSVFEGVAIYNQLKRHPAKKVVYVDGFACSVTAYIAMCGDEVIMPRGTMMMIHNAWMVAAGNAAELRKTADDLDTINSGTRQAFLEKAGGKITEDELTQLMDAETWLTAEDCIHYGFADKFAEKEADPETVAAIMQRAKLDVKQKIEMERCIAARLKETRESNTEPSNGESDGDPKSKPTVMNLFGGVMK